MTIAEEDVEKIIDQVLLPDTKRSVVAMNLLRGIEIRDTNMKVSLSDAALSDDVRDQLRNEIQDKLRGLDGINMVGVDFEESKPVDLNQVGQVIAIMSGKGGVGKSLVTGLLALAMSRQGKTVGILDADITGPSIPKMFGVNTRPGGADTSIMPAVSKTGIEIMSMNLLLPSEDDAVIWRGPLIGKCIKQFWEDVLWGKLDYLMIDLPPGTADVPLTVMQSIPLAGGIIVITPQDLTSMVVRKAANMTQQMNVPILGVVENMSYFLIPESGKKVELFGHSRGEEMAATCNAPLLGQIPIDPEIARLCDKGEIEIYESKIFDEFREAVMRILLPDTVDISTA